MLLKPGIIECFDFAHFTFIARRVGKGSRLQLAIGSMNSRETEKNYNAGVVVTDESGADARTMTVNLYHDDAHPSALYVPIARDDAPNTASSTDP